MKRWLPIRLNSQGAAKFKHIVQPDILDTIGNHCAHRNEAISDTRVQLRTGSTNHVRLSVCVAMSGDWGTKLIDYQPWASSSSPKYLKSIYWLDKLMISIFSWDIICLAQTSSNPHFTRANHNLRNQMINKGSSHLATLVLVGLSLGKVPDLTMFLTLWLMTLFDNHIVKKQSPNISEKCNAYLIILLLSPRHSRWDQWVN